MKKEDLYKEIGLIDEDLIEAAGREKIKRTNLPKKWIAIAICLMIISSISTASLAAVYYKNQNAELYIRYLTTENIELMPVTQYDADKFLKALDSDNDEYIYIAINRLVESFNNQKMRKKALTKIKPFMQDDNGKIADAAAFAVDILSQKFQSPYVYKLADDSIIFTLFNNYSDYGSQNVLWRIKENRLETSVSFSTPSMYIKEIIPSPDRNLVAIVTNSNKSDFVEILNIEEGLGSPELIESARVKYGAQKELTTWIRMDHESYSYADHLVWKNNDTLEFRGSLSYEDTALIENVVVSYIVSRKELTVKEYGE
ncbi:hypothetical protein MHB44_22890 [Lysinibacillus sp. FSL H8-0500]|uniref:hypothetical protein n=1 Tax=Lysinibacillus sp. FSL H8-0500 TaxID=2921393 RepID=UPI003100E483